MQRGVAKFEVGGYFGQAQKASRQRIAAYRCRYRCRKSDAGLLSIGKDWSEWQDLNLRPPRPERGALPGCATLRLEGRSYSGALGAPQAGSKTLIFEAFRPVADRRKAHRPRPPRRHAGEFGIGSPGGKTRGP